MPEEYAAAKSNLCENKKAAEKVLKSVRTKQKREDAKKRRITAKAASVDMDVLVKIVAMKIDMPHIECPHCECQFATGQALMKAHRDGQAGRELQLDKPGKQLAAKVPPQNSQSISTGSSLTQNGST